MEGKTITADRKNGNGGNESVEMWNKRCSWEEVDCGIFILNIHGSSVSCHTALCEALVDQEATLDPSHNTGSISVCNGFLSALRCSTDPGDNSVTRGGRLPSYQGNHVSPAKGDND